MKKDIISATLIPDKSSAFCRLDAAGEVVERGHLPLTRSELRKRFADLPTARIAPERCTQSAWVQDVLRDLGHEVIVAHAREVRSIAASSRKSDTRDAEQLAA
jgi:transposase